MGTNAYIVFSTSPFDGHKLGVKYANKKMIGIPQKKLEEARSLNKDLCIFQKPDKYEKKSKKKGYALPPYMILPSDSIPEYFAEFPDKWGRNGYYVLCYFEWKPIIQNTLYSLFKEQDLTQGQE